MSCAVLKPLQFFRKALVTASPHYVAIIKLWLNKAIINFDQNTKWSEMPNSFNCTNGTSYLLRNVFNMTLPVYILININSERITNRL